MSPLKSPAASLISGHTPRRHLQWSVLLPLVALLTACIASAPPTTYIQLSAGGVEPGKAASPQVLVDSLKMPDYLLRNSLLRRIDGNQLRYDGLYRWAEPLDIGAQRVLVQRLSADLDSNHVAGYPRLPGSGPSWRVTVSLRRFEAVDVESGARVEILADVRIRAPAVESDSDMVLRFEASEALEDSSGGSVAAALSQLLAALAQDIAAALESAGAGTARSSLPTG